LPLGGRKPTIGASHPTGSRAQPRLVGLSLGLLAILMVVGRSELATGADDSRAIRTKSIVLVDTVERNRQLTIPIMYSRNGTQWQVHPAARIHIATFLRRANNRPAQALPDALMVALYLVFQKFSVPIAVVDGGEVSGLHAGHSPGRAIDFRLHGVDPSMVWSYCRSLPGLGIGYLAPSNGMDGFIHLEAGAAGCWISPDHSAGASCGQQDPQALLPRTGGELTGRPIAQFQYIVFVDTHANDQHLSLPILYNAQPGDSFGVWPPARQKISDFLRDHTLDVALPMDDRLLVNLTLVHKHFGKPIRVVSGARLHNTVQDSRHPKGQAIDFQLDGTDMEIVWRWCQSTFRNVGVGYYPRFGTRGAFVHLDVRDRPGCWVNPANIDSPKCHVDRVTGD